MRLGSVWTPLLLVVAVLVMAAIPETARAQESAIADGGFETGAIAPGPAGLPPVIGSWNSLPRSDASVADAVEDPVLSGDYAAQIDTRSTDFGRYIYQDMEGTTPCFTWTFSVNRGEGINWVELVADWDRGGGAASPVSAVILTDDFVELRTWDTRANSPEGALSAGEWHEVVVEADATNLVQTFSIDGSVVAEVQADTAEFAPQTIIIGDVAGNAQHGLYTYDNVSLESADCPAAGEEVPEVTEEETPPAEPAAEETGQEADDDDGSGFPLWIIVVIVIAAPTALLIVLGVARRRRRSDQE